MRVNYYTFVYECTNNELAHTPFEPKDHPDMLKQPRKSTAVCTYVRTCVCACVCVCACIHVCVCTSVHMRVYACECMHACVQTCIRMCVWIGGWGW